MALLKHPRRCRSLAALSLFALTARGLRSQVAHPEYEVKAAYLLNFARYAAWPGSGGSEAAGDLVICVLGHDPFGAVLDRTVAGRTVLGRPVRVLRPANRAEAGPCQLAFVGGDRRSEIEPWLSDLSDRPVLTVGDGAQFTDAGGAIGFVVRDRTVRFEVNLDALRHSGVKLSSRVLALASRVEGEAAR